MNYYGFSGVRGLRMGGGGGAESQELGADGDKGCAVHI